MCALPQQILFLKIVTSRNTYKLPTLAHWALHDMTSLQSISSASPSNILPLGFVSYSKSFSSWFLFLQGQLTSPASSCPSLNTHVGLVSSRMLSLIDLGTRITLYPVECQPLPKSIKMWSSAMDCEGDKENIEDLPCLCACHDLCISLMEHLKNADFWWIWLAQENSESFTYLKDITPSLWGSGQSLGGWSVLEGITRSCGLLKQFYLF